ncbi:MAG: protein phosphatase CheZ [Steroidobacteraceae bacterium]
MDKKNKPARKPAKKTAPVVLKERYGAHVLNLSVALEADDEVAFVAALSEMAKLHDDTAWVRLRKLTTDLNDALDRFQMDARLVAMAENDMPDAKHRLAHVMKMTDDAAHKTMDLVERSGPLAEGIATEAAALNVLWQQFKQRSIEPQDFRMLMNRMDAFLFSAQADTEAVRTNLAEVLMTQDYQDLTGQIIRGVITLVGEVEKTLSELVSVATPQDNSVEKGANEQYQQARGYGPAVPGVDYGAVIGAQAEVDDLLFQLGM